MLTPEQFKAALPKQMQQNINQAVMDQINLTLRDPDTREMLRENMLGYVSVMQQGKFQLNQYINAVKYVSFKSMGDTNIAAYVKTFPDKYQDFLNRGVEPKDIASYNTAYGKSKLVTLITELSLIPTHILNHEVFQKAINIQAALMADPQVSHKVRSDAANSLMTHLKRPETQKIELDIAIQDGSIIKDLQLTTQKLAATQLELLKAKVLTPLELAHQSIIADMNSEDVTDV